MGGFGSGRYGGKRKAEHSHSLDVNQLHRDGCLVAGFSGQRVWMRNGERVATIGLRSDDTSMTLTYRNQFHGKGWEDVEERVPIERTPCRYGGTRPWFRCPGFMHGRHCGRRVGKLFLAGQYFRCRHCHRVVYTSQSEAPLDRLHRKRDKLRDDMGAERGCGMYIPPRPKGMWHRTYLQKCDAIHTADMVALQAFGGAAAKLLQRLRKR